MTTEAAIQLRAIEEAGEPPCPTCGASGFDDCRGKQGLRHQPRIKAAKAYRAEIARLEDEVTKPDWPPPMFMELRPTDGGRVQRFRPGPPGWPARINRKPGTGNTKYRGR